MEQYGAIIKFQNESPVHTMRRPEKWSYCSFVQACIWVIWCGAASYLDLIHSFYF